MKKISKNLKNNKFPSLNLCLVNEIKPWLFEVETGVIIVSKEMSSILKKTKLKRD